MTDSIAPANTNTNSLSKTANVAAGTGGGIVIAKWIIACIIAHHLQMPDDATLTLLCAALVPLGHAIDLAFVAWFGKKTGIELPPLSLTPEQLASLAEQITAKPMSADSLAALAAQVANLNKPAEPAKTEGIL